MDLRTGIGQKLVFGFSGPSIPEHFREMAAKYKVGNVILFRDNTVSAEQTRKLCRDIRNLVMREVGIPPLIMADEEGGMVSRLPENCLTVPGNMAVAATGKPEYAGRCAQIAARQLQFLGINMNLAPVLDVNSNPLNPVIGSRSWGDTPESVSAFAKEAILGYAAQGMLCCGKHFPGHGDTSVDSHLGLPCIDKNREELEKTELRPFREAISAGIPSVMTTHILFPQIEPDGLPATMSRRIVTGLLREEMGFGGLILSDCMAMGAIKDHFGAAKGTVAAAKAGVDLILIGHELALQEEAAELLYQAALSGDLPQKELDASLDRILRAKESLPISEAGRISPQEKATCEIISREALTLVCGTPYTADDKTFFCGVKDYRTTLAENEEKERKSYPEQLAEEWNAGAGLIGADPTHEETLATVRLAAPYDKVVVLTLNAHLRPGQKEIIRAFAAAGKKLMVIAMRNPYDLLNLPDGTAGVAAYDNSPSARTAVMALLRGEPCRGRLPVRLK